jgi:signal transduction histidine kinase/CheY-like chemotaxis protein
VNETAQQPERKSLFHDLRIQIIGVALVPLLITISVFAAYFAHREIMAGWDALDMRGNEVAQRLAETASFDLFSGNDDYLKRLLDYERIAQGCETIAISDQAQRWRLISGQSDILPPPGVAAKQMSWISGKRAFYLYPVSLQKIAENDPYLEEGDKSKTTLGVVAVVLKTDSIEKSRKQILLATLGLTSILLLGAGILAWRLSRTLTRPLQAVIAAVCEVAHGNLNVQVVVRSKGDLGELERGVNHMAGVMSRHSLEMAQRVEEATHELRTQKLAAEAAVMARSRFLAAASHDLRQPMHALILLVEALKEKLRPGNGEPLRLTEHIDASAHAMQSLLNSLLDISRLDAGVVVARPECFAVDRIFQRLEQQYRPLAMEKGVRLRVHPSSVTLFTDPVLLERILSNLLANAIRYTDQGRIILGVRRVQTDWALIEVWDSGRGIPKNFNEKIFEEYFQLENPERDRDKGLGLGLAIVQRLARLLGSPVEVRSSLGKGSCFRVRMVRCEQADAQDNSASPYEDMAAVRPGRSSLVAFIDDDESILEAMTAVFDQWGIDIAVGVDANQIKGDLLELGRKPDAILTDYRLREGRTGIEAITVLREAFGPDIPAVLITGDTAATTIQAITNSGLPVLYKPLQPAKLRAYINHMLSPVVQESPSNE